MKIFIKITPPASSSAPDPKSPTWLAALLVVGMLFVGNVCPAATTLVDYFNLQTYGTVSGGQTITDAMGNAQATLNTNANTSLTSSGLTISGGNSQVTGLSLAAGSLSGFTGSFTIQVWATIQSGGGSVLYAANNGPANGWIGSGFDGYAAIYGFTWGGCLSGGGTGNITGTAYNRYGQTAGLGYSLSAGTLYDIVLTYDATTRTFRQYVNGTLTGSQTNDFSQTSLAQAQNFTLGGGTATETWGDNSALSTTKSFLLYSGALSGSQVSSIHNLGVGASASSIQSVVSTNSYATYVWSGGGTNNNWNTGANWTNGVAPNFNTAVVFAGATQTTVNLDAGNSIRSLTFSPSAGGFTITNTANTLALTGGITNSSANPQTISVPVNLNSTQSINAASGDLIFGQNVNNNGNTVTFAGAGNITLNGSLTGGGGVVQSGTGTVTIALPIFPAGSYNGNTVIQSGGTLRLINLGFRVITSSFSGAGNLIVCTNLGGASVGPLLLWGANNLTGTTTVSNGTVMVGLVPNQSLGSTIRVLDGATFGVNARTDTNYVAPASLIIGSSTGATLQFGLAGISELGLTGTNNAPIRAANVTVNGTATINIAACPFVTNSFPLFTGYSSGNLALGSQPPGYSGKLTVSGTTVYYTVTNLDYNYRPFTHPGCLSVSADFARMKAKVQAGDHPWIDSYNLLIADGGASSNYVNQAQVSVLRNASSGNYQFLAWDANAAYELSLRWKITGDNNYADAAVRVLNAWANTCTNAGGDPNALLLALNGYQLACAAENLHTYTNWAAEDLTRFQWWFRHGPAPGVMDGWWVAVPEGWLQSRWGQCPEHEWANWDLSNMNELLAIGVFCDDRSVYNYALTYFKTGYAGNTSVQGNGTINRVIYQMHPGYMGQWQEAGRDQGHAMMGPALLGFFSEIAWNQGDDLFSLNANELLAGTEYETKWNEPPQTVVENNSIPLVLASNTVPYVYYINCAGNQQTDLSTASRGNVRMGYDLIYNHYVNLMGLDAPYTGVYLSQVRPEGAGDNDVIGYTTLTHYLDPIAPGAVPAPSAVITQVRNTSATISWWGSATATSYNVKRSSNNGASYATIASGITMDHYYVDTGLLPGSNYLYVVSAIVNGTETTNSLPVAVQANQLLAGTIIGSPGSYDGSSTIYRVFDGSLRNWYDASNSSGDWAGLDLATTNRITKLGYCPRPGNSGRMTGGRFQGCNLPDFSSGVVTLFTVPAGTADTFPPTMTYQTISDTNGYRYVRYLGPDNGNCNVAEVEFYGVPGVAGPPPALYAYLKFDESSGTSAADSTGHGWNGTLINGVTWVAGYSNNAVNLSSNSSQYVTLPTGVVSNLNEFTISAWVKQTTISTWSRIFDFGTGQTAYMFLAPRNGANNVLRFAITVNGGSGEQIIDGISALPAGVWKHVAVTLGGSRGVLYVDGVPVGTNGTMTLSPGSLGNTTQNYLGKSQFGDPYFNGQLDEFRIYNGMLSAGEVATLLTPLTAPTNVIAGAGDSQVVLSWNSVTNAANYQVFRSPTNGGPYTQIAVVAVPSYADTPLINGTKYYYVVKAANAAGTSANSTQVSARPVSVTPPSGYAALVGNQLQLSWPADHTGWRLQMNTDLSTTNWQDISGASATNQISILSTNTNAFFRLVYP
jgi:hypothetical protein